MNRVLSDNIANLIRVKCADFGFSNIFISHNSGDANHWILKANGIRNTDYGESAFLISIVPQAYTVGFNGKAEVFMIYTENRIQKTEKVTVEYEISLDYASMLSSFNLKIY